ncbi:hypothetical protein RFZ45_19660, partial [Acinetobacter baumannii]|nr:hypothetical protein [Acinetobacter baumannii]
MNELVKSNIVSKEDIIYPISNSLVLIKNNNIKDNVKDIKQIINSNFSICIGEINTVPVGQYAKDALNNTGVFD